MNRVYTFFFSTTLFLLFSTSVISQPVQVETELFASGFQRAVDLVNAGDDRFFVVEQEGRIRILNATGEMYTDPFLDISDLVAYGGERGLLGLAFHPKYQDNGLLFINYINKEGNTIIARYAVSEDPAVANANSGRTILEVDQPYSNHNGGDLEFGPDGYLYIGLGDGGSGGDPNNNAQNPQSLLGKMLRIDINANTYTIPPDNPFTTDKQIADEIWASGLRNPWRYSFDRETGDLWVADVGQNQWEEIHLQTADSQGGENYGWRCYEGNHPYNTAGCEDQDHYDFPVYEYNHSEGCSVTGGRVYRGEEYPLLKGHYFFADYCTGLFRSLKFTDGELQEFTHENMDVGTSSFGENPAGEMFILNRTDGTIHKITEVCSSLIPTITQEGDLLNANIEGVSYQWYLDGELLEGEADQTLEISRNGNYHVVVASGGCENTSEAFAVNITALDDHQKNKTGIFYPNPVTDGALTLVWNNERVEAKFTLYDPSGQKVYNSLIQLKKGIQEIQINKNLPAGNYLIKLDQEGKTFVDRVIIR